MDVGEPLSPCIHAVSRRMGRTHRVSAIAACWSRYLDPCVCGSDAPPSGTPADARGVVGAARAAQCATHRLSRHSSARGARLQRVPATNTSPRVRHRAATHIAERARGGWVGGCVCAWVRSPVERRRRSCSWAWLLAAAALLSGCQRSRCAAAAALDPEPTSHPTSPSQRRALLQAYAVRARRRPLRHRDEQVANREIRVWHGATENGP
jgi:hypothetical protein